MRSWVFRHRARLRALFCPLERAGEPRPERAGPHALDEQQAERAGPSRTRTRPAPGTLQRGARYVLLVPMPPLDERRRRSA